MLSFVNDYCECAHENILAKLSEIRIEKNTGYGMDDYCKSAADKIKKACGCEQAEVFFLVGGTQTNQVIIDSILRPYEGVVACESGHVNVHEAGAIEYTGHKVLTVPQHEGKIDAKDLEEYAATFYADGNHEHMVFPGMVYISHPTEYGTLYSKSELEAIRQVCDKYNMPLYLDGARLAYALACDETDVTMEDVARLTDVFYIGGTKCGSMFGEAVVFTKNNVPDHFYNFIKKHGAMLAKGWLLGVQFDVLFTDDLYVKIGRNAIDRANEIKKALEEKNYKFFIKSPTNQIMVNLTEEEIAKLTSKVNMSFFDKLDDTYSVMRFCTSWATKKEDVDELIKIL